MSKNYQKVNRGQPPKISLNEGESGTSAKAPPPVRPFLSPKMKADLNDPKKNTARLDFSSAASMPKDVALHDENDPKKITTRIDRDLEVAPILDDEKREVAKKAMIPPETSKIMSADEENKGEVSKKSTVRVQIDEDFAKGDTARLDAKTVAEAEESAKKRTARIDLNEVLDENDNIFKRRTTLMEAGKFAEASDAPRTIRIKRPEAPPAAALRTSTPIVEEEEATVASTRMEQNASRKSETARIDLPPEVAEQPPTRRKTIRIKRPEGLVTSRPLVVSGEKSETESSGSMVMPKEEPIGALFSVITLVAILIGIALLTFQSLTLRSFMQF